MQVEIGDYILYKRTDYSKIRLLEKGTKKDITDENSELLEKLITDYNKQTLSPEKYFEVENDSIINLTDAANNADNIFLPSNINFIKRSAFLGCKFCRIHIPDSYSAIEDYAFGRCMSLKYIELPDSITDLSESTFQDCFGLEFVKLPEKIEKIRTSTFSGCHSLNNVIIPNSVFEMELCAFNGCASLTNIKLSENLNSLGHMVFANCNKLPKVDLPEGLESIGGRCFMYCKSLEEIIIPDSVKYIEDEVFAKCESLKSIKLPKNLKVLESNLFSDCKSLEKLYIPDSVVSIGRWIFSGCELLENINIPKDLKKIDDAPFAHSSIESLTLNYDLEKLTTDSPYSKENDLLNKSAINKLIISNNVKTITPDAFKYHGKQITEIDYLGTKEEFKKFKESNKELFLELVNLSKIDFIEEKKNIEAIEYNLSK